MANMKLITSLLPNQIFVFGSNEEGVHGKGAAKQALKFGAKIGIGVGRCGQTYAIPTRKFIHGRLIYSLSLNEIKIYVDGFIEYARLNTDLEFLVTAMGTGYAGYRTNDVAPFFMECPTNCILPDEFYEDIKRMDENE